MPVVLPVNEAICERVCRLGACKMNVICVVLEKDKNELHVKLLQADKERRIAVKREADAAKKVCCSVPYCKQYNVQYSLQYCGLDDCFSVI